uniref:Uncharacterized protein n=1 Tax=Caenorhabditis japonica TaxID=281687 RepID=A0A8R1DUY6_CAEJA
MSTAPCPTGAPSYYLTATHCIAAVSAPINLYAMYLVLFRSPGLSNYKYCICYLQLSAFFTELQMTLVCPGYYFFPVLGGYNTGEFFGKMMRSHLYMTMYTFFLASELPAIVWCFTYRHNSAVDMRNRGSKPRRPLKNMAMFGAQLFPFAVAFCMYMSEISRDEAHSYLEKKYPQCLYWAKNEYFAVYDYYTNPWIAVTGVGALGLVCIYAIFFFSLGIHTMFLLQQLRSHMSLQTYRMHRTALISLSLQVVLPSVLIILPLYVCFYVVLFELVEHQALATNMTVMISGHSVCSSIVMISTNPRYRTYLKNSVFGLFGVAGVNRRGAIRRPTIEPSSTAFRRSIG